VTYYRNGVQYQDLPPKEPAPLRIPSLSVLLINYQPLPHRNYTTEWESPRFDLGKKLAELNKLYNTGIRYKAEIFDVFDTKFRIFQNTCRKIGISVEYQHQAFTFILEGKAYEFYYSRILGLG
jgi:hypothetical protein